MTIYYCYKRNPDEIYITMQTGLKKKRNLLKDKINKKVEDSSKKKKKLKRPASYYRIKGKATISKGTKATIRTIFSVYKTFMANLHPCGTNLDETG